MLQTWALAAITQPGEPRDGHPCVKPFILKEINVLHFVPKHGSQGADIRPV